MAPRPSAAPRAPSAAHASSSCASASLKEWTTHFIKHKDLFERKIVKVDDTKDGLLVHRKDGDVTYLIADAFAFPSAPSKDPLTIVCRNDPSNIKAVVKDWKKLTAHPKLTILFVNLSLGEKWMLNPRVHDLIADESTLESGLLRLMQAANGQVDDEPKRGRKPKLFEESEEGGDGDEER